MPLFYLRNIKLYISFFFNFKKELIKHHNFMAITNKFIFIYIFLILQIILSMPIFFR